MGRIFVTYNNQHLQDGYFAQLQRQLAIYSISNAFRIQYVHSPIIDLTVTQLDLYQSKKEISIFLEKAELLFQSLPRQEELVFDKIYDIDIPKIADLVLLYTRYIFSNKKILVKITNPYSIIEKFPIMYSHIAKKFMADSPNKNQTKPIIVAHIRRGIAFSHVAPGELDTRTLDDSYFREKIAMIIRNNPEINELVILTDAPEVDFRYQPIDKDLHKWEQFNPYKDENGVLIEGHKFQEIIDFFPGKTTVIRGGDVLQALEVIKSASYFLMSRSSMSFVGALLNKTGVIYYPPNFWHKPLKNWIKCS